MNIRRGAYLLAFLGLVSNPWQYLSNAATFLTVLSGFGIFCTSFSGPSSSFPLLLILTRTLLVYRTSSGTLHGRDARRLSLGEEMHHQARRLLHWR